MSYQDDLRLCDEVIATWVRGEEVHYEHETEVKLAHALKEVYAELADHKEARRIQMDQKDKKIELLMQELAELRKSCSSHLWHSMIRAPK